MKPGWNIAAKAFIARNGQWYEERRIGQLYRTLLLWPTKPGDVTQHVIVLDVQLSFLLLYSKSVIQ
jgi:hypothetical protein